MRSRLQNRCTRMDVAALVLFAALWAYFIVMVRYGVSYVDEGFYLATAERFVNGARPLVDEWQVSQLAHLFLCLPYLLFVKVTGGTAGIILFMRYLFLLINAVFYWCMYVRMRPYGWPALAATLLFCAYVPCGIYACNYYTVPLRILMIVCMILLSERHKPWTLFFAGVLLSCAVVAEPGYALLYFGFTVLVFVRFLRQKKGKRFLNGCGDVLRLSVWLPLTCGICLCAVIFVSWLLARSGLRNIIAVLPYLFLTDPEYDYSANGNVRSFFLQKASITVQFFGPVCTALAVLVVVCAVVYACGLIHKRRETAQKLLFGMACAVWIFSCTRILLQNDRKTISPVSFFMMSPLPLLWFGFVCFLLCEQKNKRVLPFWIVGLCTSLSVDFFSDVSLAVGGPIAYIADAVFFSDLVRELRAASSAKKSGGSKLSRNRQQAKCSELYVRAVAAATCVCFAVWYVGMLGIGNTIFPEHHLVSTPLHGYTEVCEKGPSRSLRYPASYVKLNNDKLADIDTLKKKQPERLYVCGMAPELYLYAGLPCSSSSSWTWRRTPYVKQQAQYWNVHPELRPDCIYFPFDEPYNTVEDRTEFLAWMHENFDPLCTYTEEEGLCGYILYVTEWKESA